MSYSPSYQEGPTQARVTRGLAVGAGAGQVNKYYVRPAGNDANDGLTIATAFATLAHALTQIPDIYTSEGYFIDITGINESMSGVTIPTVSGAPGFIALEPSGLIFGLMLGQLCIHSDLVVSQTVLAADMVSVNSDPTTGQQTIVTTGGLVVNSLVGKQIKQGLDLYGVVRSNTATDIVTTAMSLSNGVNTEFCDPGATLGDMYIEGVISTTQIEGIYLDTDGGNSLLFLGSSGNLIVNNCSVGTFLNDRNVGQLNLISCYIIPSSGGNINNVCYTIYNSNNSFFDGVSFNTSYNGWGFGIGQTHFNSAFDGCGPIWNSGAGGIRQVNGFGFCFNCEFVNPIAEAIYIYGSGAFNVENVKIDGAVGDAIRIAGPAIVDLQSIPAGVGNLGVGCKIENGAQVNAVVGIALTGAGGDVKIGTLAAQTWASVTGAANNRVTDSGANGDTSSARRP